MNNLLCAIDCTLSTPACLAADPVDDATDSFDREALAALLRIAHAQLESADSSIEETLIEIRRVAGPGSVVREQIQRLEYCVLRYDYEAALAELNQLKDTVMVL